MRLLVFLLWVAGAAAGQEQDTLLPRILQVKNDTERVNQLYRQGFAFRNTDPQLSFDYGKLCEQHALQAGSQKHLAKSYNLLGVLYYKKGNYLTAMDYHTKALRLREQCGDVLGIAFSQVNLGNVYNELELYNRAEAAYLAAITAYKKAGAENVRIANCLLNIGTIKHSLKQYDQAIENYRLAAELTPPNDQDTKAIFLTNMAQACIAKGDIEKGIAANEDALKLRLQADNHLETGDNYLNLGGAYIIQNDLIKAKYYLDTAYYIASVNQYASLRYEACKVYALYYSQEKDFEKAFYWQLRYGKLKDSLQLQQLAVKQTFDFNDLERKAPAAYEAASLHNTWLLAAVVVLLVTVPFTLTRYKR